MDIYIKVIQENRATEKVLVYDSIYPYKSYVENNW